MTAAMALVEGCIRGARVSIRPYARDDADRQRFWPVYDDPLLESYNLRLKPDGVEPYWQSLQNRTDYARFSIEDEVGDFVGTLSLRDLTPGGPTARLGLVIRADRTGSGLGGAALATFLGPFFGSMGFQRLDLDVAATNFRAIRLYERLGFCWAGRHWQTVEIFADEMRRVGGYDRFPHYFRAQLGQVWMLHYDMSMTREDHAAGFGRLD